MEKLELTAVMRAKVMGRNYKHVTRVPQPGEVPARENNLWTLPNLSAADIGAICMRAGSGDAALIPSLSPFKHSGAV